MISKRGFTLVEILIVVVILGIIATIVVPSFSDSGTEVKTSALATDLRKVRTQIELYKFHHKDMLPTASGETSAGFEQRLISQTDIDGNAGTDYGPYMQRIPINPFNNLNIVRIDGLLLVLISMVGGLILRLVHFKPMILLFMQRSNV